ncbi:carbohydrate-binding family 9-like protein [uncultured Polaribacter sp.]|uniref:carbohydrate-binding family 9-like protein n=1 Tax=uncultured Polaribacter sp. TaxID=174711 RepID=UPI00261B8ABC|nr:carbohydrate-binding family 9-like protein [uncultured Polaribacter sp.]
MNTYKVKNVNNKNVQITGDDKNIIWKTANSLTNFSCPWNNRPINKTEFKAIHNSENIFFQFKVDDPQTYIHSSANKNESINNSDRVELFFRSDASLNPYYCLEIDPTSRIMDFKAQPNKKFDFNWNWAQNQIAVKSSIHQDHYIVEIVISLQSLRDLNVLKDNSIETGIYRAKYNKTKDKSYQPTWITWINPNTETPNFHTPTSFGLLELENL